MLESFQPNITFSFTFEKYKLYSKKKSVKIKPYNDNEDRFFVNLNARNIRMYSQIWDFLFKNMMKSLQLTFLKNEYKYWKVIAGK